jgi:hypothetical protein
MLAMTTLRVCSCKLATTTLRVCACMSVTTTFVEYDRAHQPRQLLVSVFVQWLP